MNLVALRRRALVAPDNRRAQDVPCFIQHDQTVHLTADAHRNDVLLIHTGLRQHAADGVHRRMIPVLRLLLRPAVVRLIQRIFHQRGADRRAILVEQHRFGAGRAKVNTKNILHRKNPPLFMYRNRAKWERGFHLLHCTVNRRIRQALRGEVE